MQVVKLPADYVFFRVRSDGSIPEPDYLLPGYEFAKQEIAARKEALAAGKVAVPNGDTVPRRHTWRMSKTSRAGQARKRFLDSLQKQAEEAAAAERYDFLSTFLGTLSAPFLSLIHI